MIHTRRHRSALWRRRWIWMVGLPLYTVLLVPVGTVLIAFPATDPPGPVAWLNTTGELLGDAEWWRVALIGTSVIAASQFVFLLPVVRLRPPAGTRSRSLGVSLLLGAVVAALLTLAMALGLTELIAGLLAGADPTRRPWGNGGDLLDRYWAMPGVFVTLVGSWAMWAVALLIFTRRLWADSVLGRLVLLLLGGTVVELLVVVPVDLMVRRRTDCYCATGTFLALCLSAVALLWLAGPGIVLALSARRRRLMRQTHCARCGQPKGPSPGPACPECGYAWTDPKTGVRWDSNP